MRRKALESVELEPNAWDRFTSAVHKIAPPRRRQESNTGKSAAEKHVKPER